MDFLLARAAAPLLQVVDSIGSTNVELAERERRAPQPHGTAIATLDQTAGRGRLEREWVAPAGSALAMSVLLHADLAPVALPWLPLIGGLAARDAVAAELPGSIVSVKWPNDVLVTGVDGLERKAAGVLAERIAATGAVVLGVGVNTAMRSDDLPVPTATSIRIEDPAASVAGLHDRVAAAVLSGVLERFAALVDASGVAALAGLRAEAEARCGSIGRRVRVMLPGGDALTGTATGLDASGALVLSDDQGTVAAVRAGDVTHLRYE